MHYVIYPDTLFVENFICNLLFLTFMKSLFFPAAKGKRIFLAASITAICNTLVSILLFHMGLLRKESGAETPYGTGTPYWASRQSVRWYRLTCADHQNLRWHGSYHLCTAGSP